VKSGAALANATGAMLELAQSGLRPAELRDRVLPRLGRVVPFDAAFWATVDPATLLFTQPHQQNIPHGTIPYFIQNEFLDEDVNKWTALAARPGGVATLAAATAGAPETSARYRDIFRPLGLGDELRAVMRIGDACWGFICLHREAGSDFTGPEVEYVRRLAPHLAEAIRVGLLQANLEMTPTSDAPGLVVIAQDGSFVSSTAAGDLWLDELGYGRVDVEGLPPEIQQLAARLREPGRPHEEQPRLLMRTRAGRWALLHASRLPAGPTEAVAVIIEEPSPAELAPVLMQAYRLTRQERRITELVCRGLSTRQICEQLHIAEATVQDHLKSIFDKTGVRSRRELVTVILREQYLPRAATGTPVGPSGFFLDA